jgi:hypothetical protein
MPRMDGPEIAPIRRNEQLESRSGDNCERSSVSQEKDVRIVALAERHFTLDDHIAHMFCYEPFLPIEQIALNKTRSYQQGLTM